MSNVSKKNYQNSIFFLIQYYPFTKTTLMAKFPSITFFPSHPDPLLHISSFSGAEAVCVLKYTRKNLGHQGYLGNDSYPLYVQCVCTRILYYEIPQNQYHQLEVDRYIELSSERSSLRSFTSTHIGGELRCNEFLLPRSRYLFLKELSRLMNEIMRYSRPRPHISYVRSVKNV